MKRVVIIAMLLFLIAVAFSPAASAYDVSVFDDSVDDLKNSLSDEARERMSDLGVNDIHDVGEIQVSDVFSKITEEFSSTLAGPLSSAALVVAVLLIVSLLEGYTDSLRHTEMKDILSAVTSLFLIIAVVTPMSAVIRSSVTVIQGAGALMLLYLPLMVGILMFSGHLIHAGGYYATVMSAAQLISWVSSAMLAPMLSAYLAVSACAGISGHVRLKGFCDLVYRFVRWSLTFVMCVFTAVLALQSVAAGAADTIASRAARFTLSSLIPVVGSAVSEAYKTLQSSVNLLRSGVGIFTLLGVMVSFAPVLLRAVVWLLTLNLSRCTAQALSVDSAAYILESLSSVMSMLIAVVISVLSVFLISTASLLMIGGAS